MPIKFQHLDTGKVDTTESFFSDQFLRARIGSANESNKGFDQIFDEGRDEDWREQNWKEIKENELKYDEDVNHYITLMLADLVNPRSLDLVHKYTVSIDADVGQIAVTLQEKFKKYFLYKINADFLLLNLGLFHPDTNILGNAYFDKGETYYFCAASSLKEVKGGRSGMTDVLEKLSIGFGKYVEILRHMKNSADNFLSFHFKIDPGEMRKMEETLTLEAKKHKE